jgi:hypothetical protein
MKGFMGKRESGRAKVKTHTSKTGNTEMIFMNTQYSKMKREVIGAG